MTMSDPHSVPADPSVEADVRSLYHRLISAWNGRDAGAYAELFTYDGSVVGFDGSPVDGREAIRDHLSGIFADHVTATYVTIVREVRLLSADVALLRGVVGMIPPGKTDLNPAANAVQTLVAVRQTEREGGGWRVTMFHNTPAAFHGRPEASEALTQELRAVYRQQT